ncbi:MAG TPA: hypothetical protein VMD97_05085 [Candidatus Aquilonibacter sp.]|nr:hypothetical protein [Candidatus Aquilonibacter sp.]
MLPNPSPFAPAKLGLASLGLLACLACHAPVSGTASAAVSSPEAPAPQWTQFADPNEHAFTVDVPRGWTVKGGLFRFGYSDERVMVDMRSPDGKINIRLGDVSIPIYVLPTPPYHTREGEVYDLGAQAHMVVARYRTGPEYAVLYAPSRFSEVCHDPRSDTSFPAISIPDAVPVPANASQSSSGQIAYRCQGANGPLIAFAYTKTVLTGSIWQASSIVSFSAPPDKLDEARSLLAHSAESFHLSPQWIQYQQQMDAEGLQYQRQRQQGRMVALQQQQQQFEAKMRAMQNQVNAFEAHQAAFAKQQEGFSDILNGVTPTTNPLTGETRKVWTGTQDNYWENGVGQVVNSHDAPAAGWTQLQTPH